MVEQTEQLPIDPNHDDQIKDTPRDDSLAADQDPKETGENVKTDSSKPPDAAPEPIKELSSESPKIISSLPETTNSKQEKSSNNHESVPEDMHDTDIVPKEPSTSDTKLVDQTSNLTVAAAVSPLLPPAATGDRELRPATPVKDKTFKPLVASPPPPSPPPKDDTARAPLPLEPPPKDVPPKDLPPKDLPPKDRNIVAAMTLGTDRVYHNPPLTPVPSRPASPLLVPADRTSPATAAGKSQTSSDDENDDTRSEIHNLFEKSHRASITGELLQRTPSHQLGSPLGSPALSPASLQRLPSANPSLNEAAVGSPMSGQLPPLPPRPTITPVSSGSDADVASTATPATLHKPPPPDEDLPFDFHRFLSQLRHRSADPVARFLRSFLQEFAKKQWMVHEQVKIIRDFLLFIYVKMDQCEVWREVRDTEMDNAQEGMEKLVMNRLYTQTFSPAIAPPDGKPRDERFPGRRGQHQEDIERDEVLRQKVQIYSWIREEHLDISDTITDEGGRRFLDLAVKEMLKISSYRAPRDKVICVLNCCKVIFGLLRHSKTDESADKFVPLLIYVVLRANPEHLVSNVQYILRFRNPDKLSGEAGYYLSSLMGAIQFIETLDRSSLTITAEEFEANVEAAVAAIAERPPPPPPPPVSEKPRRSGEGRHNFNPSSSRSEPHEEISDEKAAVAGLLRTIQKPLTTIGRIFSDDTPASPPYGGGGLSRNSPEGHGDALLTAVGGRRGQPTKRHPDQQQQIYQQQYQQQQQQYQQQPPQLTAAEAAARQTSAEEEEARRIGRIEYENVVEILKGMFPALDREIIGDVVRMKEGRVGLAVDACLALSSTI